MKIIDAEQCRRKKLFRKLTAISIAVFVLFLVSAMKLSAPLSEFFAKTLSRPLRTIAGFLTSLVPFSVFECCIIAAVFAALVFVVTFFIALFRKSRKKVLDKIVSLVLVIVSVVALYFVTAQFDYERPAPDKPWITSEMSVDEFRKMTIGYAKAAGELASSLPKDKDGYSIAPAFEDTAKKMQNEVQKYAGGDYGFYAPLPKAVQNSWVMDMAAVLGITFAPLNEASLNAHIHGLDLPYYMAHELAHALGIMSEREANIFAAYVTLNSDDPYILYSGYRALLAEPIRLILTIDKPKFDFAGRLAEVIERYGIPESAFVNLSYEERMAVVAAYGGAEAVAYLTPPPSETEKAIKTALAEDYFKDEKLPYYTPDVPELLESVMLFFNELSRAMNDWYLKMSGLEGGTGDYNTGGSTVTPPSGGGDEPEIPMTVEYSETIKIFIWLFQN